MIPVKPKKFLGQHFLKNENIAEQIVKSLLKENYSAANKTEVLEIGPGMGVLTKYLMADTDFITSVVEIDYDSIHYLEAHYPALKGRILQADFLQMNLDEKFQSAFFIIGNFPYNISSQIMFKVLEHRDKAVQLVGMFQKEVAERIAAKPGKKAYGILSVLMQTYYDVELLFTVEASEFNPPPSVQSAVIRCVRKKGRELNCDEKLFKRVVKEAFNQRRKMLRNALAGLTSHQHEDALPFLDKRAETLSWQDFEKLTQVIQEIIQPPK